MVSRQIHPIGVDIFTPDFQMLAKGFGCEAVRLKKPGDLPGQLRKAAKRKTATVIEIDEDSYVANFGG
jgi:acetolactate synthase I/II/III large subunit